MRKSHDVMKNTVLEKPEARRLAIGILKLVNPGMIVDLDKFTDKQIMHMLRSDIAYITVKLEKE